MATTTAPKLRSETAGQILDLAETLIQTRGYSAFSYQDIADSLGIRKASIHYHFPSKADLGVAVVDRYMARFDGALTAIADGAAVVADASAWQAVVSTAMQTRIVRIRCVLSVASHIR